MAGITDKEYYNFVDEALVMFGGGAPCVHIDRRMWSDFTEKYKVYNDRIPKTIDWSFDQVTEWLEAYEENTDQ